MIAPNPRNIPPAPRAPSDASAPSHPSDPATFLLQYFDRLAEAPGGIAKLRGLFLQLAVAGKLGTHNPKDELLENTGRYFQKISEKECVPTDEQFLGGIPANWRWIRFEWLGEIFGGHTPSMNRGDFWDGTIPWVSPKDMHVEEIEGTEMHVTEKAIAETRLKLIPAGSLFFVTRSGILKRKLPVAINAVRCTVNQDLKVLTPYNTELTQFIRLLLRGHEPMILKELVKTGTTVQSLKFDEFRNKAFPFPPLAEQRRIVEKVEELMGLCDALEAAQRERETVRTRLRTAALHQLASPDSDSKFAAFLLQHFQSFTIIQEDVADVRRVVLDFAIRGKLTQQTNSDEPASKLHARLVTDIKAHAKQNGISEHTSAVVLDEEAPWPAPAGWVWTKLTGLFRVITDGDHQPPPKAEEGIAFLTIGNVTTGTLDFSNCRFVPEGYWNSLPPHRRPAPGDILYTVVGATYGRPTLVDTNREFCVQRHIAILKPANETDTKFLMLFLASRFAYDQATRCITGTAQPTVPLRPLRNFLVPLPPLAEQRRIVAKVDELMAVLDNLEAALTTTRTTSESLLAAAIAGLSKPRPIAEVIDFQSSPEFIRATLAAEVTHRLRDDRHFGQTKLQKIVYLVEHVFQLPKIDSRYARYPRGPHDRRLIEDAETGMKNCEWFEAVPRDNGKGKEYHPLAKAGAQRTHFEKLWPAQAAAIRDFIDMMKTWNTDRCERFATVFAAWNDLLLWRETATDASILKEVLQHWHPDKLKISKSDWEDTISWMRQKGYVPVGWGRATKSDHQAEFFPAN